MNNKNLITILSLLGAIGAFLPWIGGPFGFTISGIEGDGVIVLILLAIVCAVNLFVKEERPPTWQAGVLVVLSMLASLVTGYTAFRIVTKSGIDPDIASMVSIQYGLVMSFVGSLGSLVFSMKR